MVKVLFGRPCYILVHVFLTHCGCHKCITGMDMFDVPVTSWLPAVLLGCQGVLYSCRRKWCIVLLQHKAVRTCGGRARCPDPGWLPITTPYVICWCVHCLMSQLAVTCTRSYERRGSARTHAESSFQLGFRTSPLVALDCGYPAVQTSMQQCKLAG